MGIPQNIEASLGRVPVRRIIAIEVYVGVLMLMETAPSKYEVQREFYSAGSLESVLG